jgi:hypothetical protein
MTDQEVCRYIEAGAVGLGTDLPLFLTFELKFTGLKQSSLGRSGHESNMTTILASRT